MAAFAIEVQGDRVMDVFDEINRMSEAQSLNLTDQAKGGYLLVPVLFSPSCGQPLK